MTRNADSTDGIASSGIRRYVPLVIYAIVILTFLCIPLKIISYGYLPPDDAQRHAAKAVSGKPWPEILVLNEDYTIDHNFGWHLFLRQIYLWSHCDAEGLVVFSVAFLLTLIGWSAIPWLKRPEAWLATMILVTVGGGMITRLALGRPFLLTEFAVLTILFVWNRNASFAPGWRTAAAWTALVSLSVFVHGAWYLWVLPVAAFTLARQFRWALVLGASWFAGTVIGASLTGHPIAYIASAVNMAAKAFESHQVQRTLVGEFQPTTGDFPQMIMFAGLLILRSLAKLESRPILSNPAFWLASIGWLAGFKAGRFDIDWGWPAFMVLLACDLDCLIRTRFRTDSLKRLGLTCCLSVIAFLATTSDGASRWTYNLTKQYLVEGDPEHPELEGWLPDKGGTIYSADMGVFYETFLKNPHAEWRYILGYESAIMPAEDFKTYHSILWNFGDTKAYNPWVDKMRPQDRLILRGSKGSQPNIPRLEWKFPVSGFWIGRLPRTNSVAPASTPSSNP